ncbi:MAG: CHASE2 domain-containing protein [Pseudomonadota bacterium]
MALIILAWTTSLCVLSEVTLDGTLETYSSNFTRPFSSARQFLFDSYQKSEPRSPQSQPVTIVAIDETSLAQVGQWPWPRNRLAQLIDAINGYGPAAIGLDMYMPEADQTSPALVAENLPPDASTDLLVGLLQQPSHDTVLAESLAAAPSVLGAAGFDFETFTSSAGMRSVPLRLRGEDPLPHMRRFEAVLVSLPELQAAASGQALLSVDLDFGVVRRIPLVAAVAGVPVSGLAMEMLRVATGSPEVAVDADKRGIRAVSVADLEVPTQPGGDVWLHFSRVEDNLGRYVTASSVLDGSVDPSQLAGKLVVLGLTGFGLNDMRTTALGELVAGIEIQAQLIESLFDGRFLVRPWWMKWLEVGGIVALGLFLVWFIPRTDSPLAAFLKAMPRAMAWIALALNALLVALGFVLFVNYGLLFDASSLFLVLSAVIASLVSSALIEIDREATQRNRQAQLVSETAHHVAGHLAATVFPASASAADKRREEMDLVTRRLAEAVEVLVEGRELPDQFTELRRSSGITGRDIVSDQVIGIADGYLTEATRNRGSADDCHRAAMAAVESQAGEQFDPELVEQFMQLGPAIERQLARLRQSAD